MSHAVSGLCWLRSTEPNQLTGMPELRSSHPLARRIIMRPAASLSSVALALSIGLFSFAITALAGPKEDVGAAAMAWAQALGENDPEKVLPFYAEDAVLWGTLSPNV